MKPVLRVPRGLVPPSLFERACHLDKCREVRCYFVEVDEDDAGVHPDEVSDEQIGVASSCEAADQLFHAARIFGLGRQKDQNPETRFARFDELAEDEWTERAVLDLLHENARFFVGRGRIFFDPASHVDEREDERVEFRSARVRPECHYAGQSSGREERVSRVGGGHGSLRGQAACGRSLWGWWLKAEGSVSDFVHFVKVFRPFFVFPVVC